ncbi:MAG: hypothetical protein ACXV8R_13145 [Acidimicrobiia bacterium]
MTHPPGPLLPSDELLTHQIVDTFARVGERDRSWTEKVCAMAAAKDGSLQLSLGLGKYTNRGVMDAYAGISRGVEQWTVRSSRALAPNPETTAVGPIRYEVVEPLQQVRFALDANDVLPISFEWVLSSPLPPAVEAREVHVSRDRYRVDADIIRYHHGGTASGWVEIDGRRTTFEDAAWVSTRDHSWGVRYQVGAPLPDIAPVNQPAGTSAYVLWFPVFCERADGSRYGLHFYYQRFAFGDWSRLTFEGGVEHADGRKEPFTAARPDLRFDDRTRRFLGGELACTMRDGTERVFTLEPVSDTGFHLATGLYGGFDNQYHGQWRGPAHVDGEYFPDCTAPDALPRVRQHRQTVVRVEDPSSEGVGFGDLQSIVTGAHPDLGLTEAGPAQ